MRFKRITRPALVLLAGFLFFFVDPTYLVAADHCEDGVARLVSLEGQVEVKRSGAGSWTGAAREEVFCTGDTIRVGKNSRAAVQLQNDAVLRLDRETVLTFSGVEQERTYLIDLLKGAAHFFSRGPKSLKVKTPFVNAAVEGTEFSVAVDETQADVSLFQGRVRCSNDKGEVLLAKGQGSVAREGQAPTAYTLVRPLDAVAWALYYPPVVEMGPEALDRLSFADKKVYQAAWQLSLGQVREASAKLNEALALDRTHSSAMALQAIIAVVSNQKDEALTLAQQAVSLNPESATAHLALSYARQARFDLEGALADLETAVSVAPHHALCRARLSELRLCMGDVDGAFEAAQQAAKINPKVARTQTVLGFAYLAKFKVGKAAEAFKVAIDLDQAAPLPRLGLGLCEIRCGDLKKGRQRLEVAAGLDPGASLYRSYLGKAYFEEKNNRFSEKQFAMAKQLDPKDPTPWLYDAVRKQSINRPVEAFQDLQKSIELNDNRAVYRSRLLLDKDLATRSASLGRIYNNLGFGQLALNEGFKSISVDPGNYSAHRFLADTYSNLPRHEIARVSELLQSQLLQPINLAPVQPTLAENGLYIYQGLGPSDISVNEFTPLFNRNRLGFQLSGVSGGNDIFGNDAVFSSVYNNASFSVGQFHYETDGYRINSDQEQNVYNAFFQIALSSKTSLQSEYRYVDEDKGDMAIRFDSAMNIDNQREKIEREKIRFGFRHTPSDRSDIIGSIIYGTEKCDVSLSNQIPFGPMPVNQDVYLSPDVEGVVTELQHQFRHRHFRMLSGMGYYHDEARENMRILYQPEMPPIFINVNTSETDRTNHTFLYLYSIWDFPENFSWTIGASADFFDGDQYDDKNNLNPKLGLIWHPYPGTIVRCAAFRTLSRRPISDQTIEPTQVAGFNQFYEDIKGTEIWRYGFGIDQKFFRSIYGGLEVSVRDMDVPFIDVNKNRVYEDEAQEYQYRVYAYWAPVESMAIKTEYLFERFENDSDSTVNNFKALKTHRVPLGISFYHPKGITVDFKTTYVDQRGNFGNSTYGFIKDEDQFCVVDAGISYRLPKRYGLISMEAKKLV